MRRLWVLAVLAASWSAGAHAGTPPASCLLNGCSLTSDNLVFAEGDPVYEITARITFCDSCVGQADGSFTLYGDAEVDFGPYHASSPCSPGDETVHMFLGDVHLDLGAGTGGGAGGEDTYVPFNSSDVFTLDAPTPELRSGCVTQSGRLGYRIPFVKLTGAEGARVGDPGLGESAPWLVLPESVRGEDLGGLTNTVQLPGGFRLTQDLTFSASEMRTDLMMWPDGMPFKLGPFMLDYTEQQVSFTPDDGSGGGPAAYTPNPPASPDLAPGQEISCDPAKPDFGTKPCTTQIVSNSGYFNHPSWSFSDPATFTDTGMTVNLGLGLGSGITYQPLFPSGTWLEVTGPANVSIVDGTITGGSFNGGTGWLRINEDICSVPPRERTFALRTGADQPQIGTGGSLLAGVEDLNPLDGMMTPQPIDWGVSDATNLGCGSLFVPPVLPGTSAPADPWDRSAVPAVFDRGIYPGFNYNRDRVCHDSLNVPLQKLCVVDGDCDALAGETCQDGGFAPLCPALSSVPTWNTHIEDVAKSFPIEPAVATPDSGHEMAFVARMSGVLGVFDAGDTFFPITTLAVPSTDLGFDTYGLAYRHSRSNADTITRGSVIFPWPANTTVPFVDMTFCDCGYLDEGHAPDVLIENTLDYWHAKFSPYAIKFTDDTVANTDCKDPHLDGDCAPSKTVILEAVTPVPQFEPDPVTCFAMDSAGDIGPFVPLSGPRVEFDRDKINLKDPYLFDLEQIELNSWILAGSPPSAPPYGYYDVGGDLSVPYFGLTSAAIQIQPEDRSGTFYYPANLHQRGNLTNSFVSAQRGIAGATLVPTFKLDYFGPEATADPADGDDRDDRGRGKIYAFSEEAEHGLGAANVAAGMILEENGGCIGDLGAMGAVRMWGATEEAYRDELENIIDPANVNPEGANYDDALNTLTLETGRQEYDLPLPDDPNLANLYMKLLVLDTHAHDDIEGNVGTLVAAPSLDGDRCVGVLEFSPNCDRFERAEVLCNWEAKSATDCPLFALRDAKLQIARHTKEDRMAIMGIERALPRSGGAGGVSSGGGGDGVGPSGGMGLPADQSIRFPDEAPSSRGGEPEEPEGVHWEFDFLVDHNQMPPEHTLLVLAGATDLEDGGISGMGFDELPSTLKFYGDGNHYFESTTKIQWADFKANGTVLMGRLEDVSPLQDHDPNLIEYLGNITDFNGAYQKTSLQAKISNYSCTFDVGGGVAVAGWGTCSQSAIAFGGKARGWINGEALCFVSVRGDMTLFGGRVDHQFKTQGNFWLGGGIGFCEPESWDERHEVLDDDFCLACVLDTSLTGTFPPATLDLQMEGPDVECNGPF